MDQGLAVALAVCGIALFVTGYWIGLQERKARRLWVKDGVLHCDGTLSPKDVEAIRDLWVNPIDGAVAQ